MAILFIRNENIVNINHFIEKYKNSDNYVLKNKQNKERNTNILKSYYLGRTVNDISKDLQMNKKTVKTIIENMCFYYNMKNKLL